LQELLSSLKWRRHHDGEEHIYRGELQDTILS